MKHLLYGTALALLLAVVTGQDADECIQSLIDSQSERVASTCGYLHVQNLQLESVCDQRLCYDLLAPIYCTCKPDEIVNACGRPCNPGPPVTTSGAYGGGALTSYQTRCIVQRTQESASSLAECTGLSSLEALCGQDACSVLVQEIYALCDASEFYSAVCSGQIGPTNEQSQCLQRNTPDFTQDIVNSCSLEAIAGGDLSAICDDSDCRAIFQRLYASCNYNEGLQLVCGTGTGGGGNGGGGGTGGGGGGGTGGGGIPDPPSVEQLQCLSNAILDRDIVNNCGSVQITDLSSLCDNKACVMALKSAYSNCGYGSAVDYACGGLDYSGGLSNIFNHVIHNADSTPGKTNGATFNAISTLILVITALTLIVL